MPKWRDLFSFVLLNHDSDNNENDSISMNNKSYLVLTSHISETVLVVQGRDQVRYSVKCSFLEIYNETITDLLKPSSGNLNLREDMKRGCYVDNLTEQIVLNGMLTTM